MRDAAFSLIEQYYQAFNAADMQTFLDLLTEDVVHDINQGGREVGKAAFAAFMARMNQCYEERLVDIEIMVSPDGQRAAAEFVVLGRYLDNDEGLPPASGQQYRLPAGAFFELRNNKVARISNYYNLNDWLAQVGGAA
ncbi:ketosteroid isomerase-related protein [Marinobacterium rhizophilum]|uniref:Nuclear transport factor 2 family protein n=1 Tax=Marinobacterium rhizophilum TaxID=420402 RepID=A0ABY5HLY6_9GAMM|nr:ketosteroid isomerase-related protein [Marinobacterium rhizophilum]UTW12974.1 nuclear transport factor 2 family protein [Marinobacterium rhizophilum]